MYKIVWLRVGHFGIVWYSTEISNSEFRILNFKIKFNFNLKISTSY